VTPPRRLLKVCAGCGRYLDPEGVWRPVEVPPAPEVAITHGICSTCRGVLYPDSIPAVTRPI
jgi:hypothetical protein